MDIRERIRRHLELTGISDTRFGREAVGDPRLLSDMRLGRQLGPRIRRRIERYLAAQAR